MQISLRKMLEAGAHFGHQTKYWHPAMSNYIFGYRNKIHIINLEKTLEKFQEALNYIGRLTKNGGNILFVGTKRQCREIIKDEATKALKNIDKIFQIVLIDPPYNTNITEKCLFKLKELNLINQDSYIFAESSKAEDFNYDGYQILDRKLYGNSKLTILRLLSSSSIE